MAFVVGVLAVCAGVLLAAAESPHVRDRARLDRLSVLLLSASAAAVAAGVAFVVRQWTAA